MSGILLVLQLSPEMLSVDSTERFQNVQYLKKIETLFLSNNEIRLGMARMACPNYFKMTNKE